MKKTHSGITAKRNARRHFLLLQGTNSFFLDLLARKIRQYGYKTTKINFNAGDAFFYNDSNVINYKYSADDWQGYISDVSKIQGVTDLVLFDDTKPLHAIAIEELKKSGINIHVFSAPYFDNNHITLERDGANGKSPLPHEPLFYMRTPTIHRDSKPQIMPETPLKQYLYNFLYAVVAKLNFSDKYNPDFKPRSARLFKLAKKSYSFLTNSLKHESLCFALNKRKYFVATLERNNKQFIRKVIASFAAHTEQKQILVINVNGKANFRRAQKTAKKSAIRHSVKNRIFLVHDANLRRMVKKSEGMIVFDSADGIIALECEKPVIALGKTIFSFAGLANQSKLIGFWKRRTSPNPSLYGKFKNHVSARTQINGDFYSRKGIDLATSIAAHIMVFNANLAVGNNVSENV